MAGRVRDPAASRGQELLHDPVLERMERHHRQAAAWTQQGFRCSQRPLQLAELVIDVDAKRLKGPGRRIDFSAPAEHIGYDRGELPGARDRRLATTLDDRFGDPPTGTLLAIAIDDRGERSLVGAIDHISRRLAIIRHAHVERTILGEGEAAFGVVELLRRHADVEHDAVQLVYRDLGEMLDHIAETPL